MPTLFCIMQHEAIPNHLQAILLLIYLVTWHGCFTCIFTQYLVVSKVNGLSKTGGLILKHNTCQKD